jgi:hypothetical protein
LCLFLSCCNIYTCTATINLQSTSRPKTLKKVIWQQQDRRCSLYEAQEQGQSTVGGHATSLRAQQCGAADVSPGRGRRAADAGPPAASLHRCFDASNGARAALDACYRYHTRPPPSSCNAQANLLGIHTPTHPLPAGRLFPVGPRQRRPRLLPPPAGRGGRNPRAPRQLVRVQKRPVGPAVARLPGVDRAAVGRVCGFCRAVAGGERAWVSFWLCGAAGRDGRLGAVGCFGVSAAARATKA